MRTTCLFCTTKHVSQATVLLGEVMLGYPHHIHFAIGHLAEAEAECEADHPELAEKIRAVRLILMGQDEEHCLEPWTMTDLLLDVREVAEKVNGITEEERIKNIMCKHRRTA